MAKNLFVDEEEFWNQLFGMAAERGITVVLAGGNQNDYATFWKNSAVDSALNYLINVKKVPIGGTSAGMAIQGQAYYTAAMGSITSPVALSNPYGSMVTIGNNDFLKHKLLRRVITDTHYDNPDRRGRQTAFLARLFQDSAIAFYGLACDEYTAICIDSTGMAKVFGGFPTYDDNAYFIQSNCELESPLPENCTPGNPLTWDLGGLALKVYQIKGDAAGTKTFDLNDWQTGVGGTWYNWSASNGVFTQETAAALNCNGVSVDELTDDFAVNIYPIPFTSYLNIQFNQDIEEYQLVNIYGQVVWKGECIDTYDFSHLPSGFYVLKMHSGNAIHSRRVVKS
jgi:hypothetical protein